MAKTAFKAHKRHTKIRPYSWDWNRPYDPSQFGELQFPNFSIDFILDRAEGLSPEIQDCPDKSALLQYVKQTRAQLAEGKWKEAARSAYIVGFFDGRLALSDDASVGKDHRNRAKKLVSDKALTLAGNQALRRLLEPKLRRLMSPESNIGFTDACRTLAADANVGRDRVIKLLRPFAIKENLYRPRPRKKKS